MFKKTLTSLVAFAMLTGVAYADKLSDVKDAGVLKAGVKYDFKPFGFVNEAGKVVGFDIDLLKYIAKDLGVDVKFQQVTSKTRIPLVSGGQIDIAAASMTHKVMRDDTIDFTVSYFFDGQSMLVRADERVRTAKGFAGKKVGAIQGATSGENFKKASPKAKIVYFQEYPQAVMALRKGKIDAVTTDLVWCSTQANDSNGKLKVTGGTLSVEPYGMGVAENESNFRDAVNFAIQKAVKDGTYSKLYKQWFGENPKVLPEVWP
ncbi:MAG: transporter substrate-binding domain-containing protein [Campylobacterota bacterium]|nr:transporter substrate-binding domain-containing protein [Campylobacterota bacterium]